MHYEKMCKKYASMCAEYEKILFSQHQNMQIEAHLIFLIRTWILHDKNTQNLTFAQQTLRKGLKYIQLCVLLYAYNEKRQDANLYLRRVHSRRERTRRASQKPRIQLKCTLCAFATCSTSGSPHTQEICARSTLFMRYIL
jgi:hypothetical protein